MRTLASFATGLIFGIGLILSGMTNPAKVQNFLDVFGRWDPSLAFVMGGAIAVAATGFAWLRGRADAPLFGDAFGWPTRTDLDAPLLIGAAVFGVGWGLGGLCPGPALTGVPTGEGGLLAFVVAMLIGFMAARWFRAARERVKGERVRRRGSDVAGTGAGAETASAGR